MLGALALGGVIDHLAAIPLRDHCRNPRPRASLRASGRSLRGSPKERQRLSCWVRGLQRKRRTVR